MLMDYMAPESNQLAQNKKVVALPVKYQKST